jgi:hypothetical protein
LKRNKLGALPQTSSLMVPFPMLIWKTWQWIKICYLLYYSHEPTNKLNSVSVNGSSDPILLDNVWSEVLLFVVFQNGRSSAKRYDASFSCRHECATNSISTYRRDYMQVLDMHDSIYLLVPFACW